MTKLKKLALLCSALLLTSTLAVATACSKGGTPSGSNSDSTSNSGSNSEKPVDPVKYWDLIDDGEIDVPNYGTTSFTYDFESAGTYLINSTHEAASFGTVEGGLTPYSLFEVEEAGEMDIFAQVYSFNYEENENVSVEYYLYKVTPATLSIGSASLDLVANGAAPVTFTAPKTATYRLADLTSGVSIGVATEYDIYDENWENVIDTYTFFTYNYQGSMLFEATEGETYTFYLNVTSNYDSFTFNYTLVEVEDIVLSTSSTDVLLCPNEQRAFTFTPSETAAYQFTATEENTWFYFWSSEFEMITTDSSNVFVPYETVDGVKSAIILNAGETYTYYVNHINSDATDLVEDTITVEKFEGDLSEGQIPTYDLTVGEDISVKIPEDGTVILEGKAVGTYTVTWNSSVTNLKVYYGMQPIENGGTFSNEEVMDIVQLTLYTSDGAALETTVRIEVKEESGLIVGENNISLDETGEASATFTAPSDGTYTFALDVDASDAKVYYDNKSTELTSTYLTADQTITLYVIGESYLEVVITVSDGNSAAATTTVLALGSNTVALNQDVTFTPTVSGTYQFQNVDTSTAMLKMYDGETANAMNSEYTFEAVAGTTYKFVAWFPAEGTTTFTLAQVSSATPETTVILSTGNNAVTIAADGTTTVEFTASQTATYNFTTTGALLLDSNGDTVTQLSLTKGDKCTFTVSGTAGASATVLVQYRASENDDWTPNY